MIRSVGLLAAITFISAGVTGCSNTGQAVQKDVAADTQAVSNTVSGARKEVHDVRENAGAAIVLTPEVKTELLRDPVVNSSSNSIDVSSTSTTVTLDGHVATEAMKRRAGEDAEVGLQKRNGHQKVVNNLKVTGGK